MKNVIATKEPFQFNLGKDAVYSFDTEEPTAISDAHYQTIVERIGSLALREVDAPQEQVKEEEVKDEEDSSSEE